MAGAPVRLLNVRKDKSIHTIHGLINLAQGVKRFLQAIVIRRAVIRLDSLKSLQDASNEATRVSDHIYMYQNEPSLATGSVESVLKRTDQRNVVIFQAFGRV